MFVVSVVCCDGHGPLGAVAPKIKHKTDQIGDRRERRTKILKYISEKDCV